MQPRKPHCRPVSGGAQRPALAQSALQIKLDTITQIAQIIVTTQRQLPFFK